MTYWANEEPIKLVGEIKEQMLDFQSQIETEIASVWRRNRRYYYPNLSGDALEFSGDAGELIKVHSNKLRLRTRQLFAILSRSKFNYRARAQVKDKNAIADTRILQGLIDHILEKDKFDAANDTALERALRYGVGYIFPTWRTDRGSVIGSDERGLPLYSGKSHIIKPNAWDVIFDTNVYDFEDLEEVKVKCRMNRHNLIAQYPELEQYIKRLPEIESGRKGESSRHMGRDLVEVIHFLHRAGPSVEKGRYMVFADENTIFFDDANPYQGVGVLQLKPEEIDETPWGYAPMNDMVPLQEMLDLSISTAASNLEAYGIGAMLNPSNNNITLSEVMGRSFIQYTPQNAEGGGKPEPLQWPQTPGEAWKFNEVMDNELLAMANLNPTLTGNPPANVTSGAFAATLQASSIEFMQPWAKPFYRFAESGMYYCLENYRKLAPEGFLIAIAGPGNTSHVRELKKATMPMVDRVSIQQQSPLASTSAGLSAMADNLLAKGLIPNVQLFLEFIETGRIQSMYEGNLSQIESIRAENDRLREAQMVHAWPTHLNPLHVAEHAAIFNDVELTALVDDESNQTPEAQQARKILKNTYEHILEHLENEKTTDPMLLAIIATGRAPQMMPPPVGGGSDGDLPSPGGDGGGLSQPAQPAAPLTLGGV